MTSTTIVRLLKTILPVLAVTVAITGCSKKAEPPAAVTAPAADTTPATALGQATPTQATPTAVIAPSTDPKKSYAEMDAALKAKAYEKAVQAMLAVQQRQQMTEAQAAEARAQMVGLQQNLAAAVASGDPGARAAADLLRRSAMAH